LHHSFAVSTGASYHSLGDADTTRLCGGVKSKKNVFQKLREETEKRHVSFGRCASFFDRSRATVCAARCAKPVDAVPVVVERVRADPPPRTSVG
jgi:hypothetical protein